MIENISFGSPVPPQNFVRRKNSSPAETACASGTWIGDALNAAKVNYATTMLL